MFPYADYAEAYWTGYFTSRANSKSQVRFSQANLHASNKLFAAKVIDQEATDSEIEDVLNAKETMMDAMGINQHHDAITGTARQLVADNYAELISGAMEVNNSPYIKGVQEIASKYANLQSDNWQMCSVYNGTYHDCPISASDGQIAVAAQNPSTV